MTGKVLITGGLGYLGGRIASAFISETSFDVVLATRHIPNEQPDWIGRSKLVTIDLAAPESLDAACESIDCIIHLAALNEIESANDPVLAVQVNTLGTLHMLEAAQRHKVRRFVYFSTAHVYGAPLAGRIDESTLPQPVHPYAITHRAAEDFVFAAHRRCSIEGVTLRLSNGYGAPADAHVKRWTLVANDLCRQAVCEKQLTLNSPDSGLQVRDFVTITDVARASLHISSLPKSALGNGMFNLGGENSMRVHDLAERIADRCSHVLGYKPPLNYPAPTGNKVSLNLDYRIDKLKKTGFDLGGDMNVELDATLRLCSRAFGNQTQASHQSQPRHS